MYMWVSFDITVIDYSMLEKNTLKEMSQVSGIMVCSI